MTSPLVFSLPFLQRISIFLPYLGADARETSIQGQIPYHEPLTSHLQ